MIAQTNLQLYQQLEQQGFPDVAREQIALVYQAVMPMFAACYRGSGKPFICHLVGTASILAAEQQDIEVISAGLLHAVYMAGDFGFEPGTRQTARKRRLVVSIGGEKAAALVDAYDRLVWNEASVRDYQQRIAAMDEVQRAVLVIALANTLEDLADAGLVLAGGAKARQFTAPGMQSALVELARDLGLTTTADGLEAGFVSLNAGHAPVAGGGRGAWSSWVLPPSARWRPLPRVIGFLRRRLRRLSARVAGSR